eukprot:g16642.t1
MESTALAVRGGRATTTTKVVVSPRAASETEAVCEIEAGTSSPLESGGSLCPADAGGRRKRSRLSMAGAAAGGGFSSSPEPGTTAVTTAEESEEAGEAVVPMSADGEGAANAKRGGARRTVEMPDEAEALARVTLSCEIEPIEGGGGRGTDQGSASGPPPSCATPVPAGYGAPVGVACKKEPTEQEEARRDFLQNI